jgi:hypothetical protein
MSIYNGFYIVGNLRLYILISVYFNLVFRLPTSLDLGDQWHSGIDLTELMQMFLQEINLLRASRSSTISSSTWYKETKDRRLWAGVL